MRKVSFTSGMNIPETTVAQVTEYLFPVCFQNLKTPVEVAGMIHTGAKTDAPKPKHYLTLEEGRININIINNRAEIEEELLADVTNKIVPEINYALLYGNKEKQIYYIVLPKVTHHIVRQALALLFYHADLCEKHYAEKLYEIPTEDYPSVAWDSYIQKEKKTYLRLEKNYKLDIILQSFSKDYNESCLKALEDTIQFEENKIQECIKQYQESYRTLQNYKRQQALYVPMQLEKDVKQLLLSEQVSDIQCTSQVLHFDYYTPLKYYKKPALQDKKTERFITTVFLEKKYILFLYARISIDFDKKSVYYKPKNNNLQGAYNDFTTVLPSPVLQKQIIEAFLAEDYKTVIQTAMAQVASIPTESVIFSDYISKLVGGMYNVPMLQEKETGEWLTIVQWRTKEGV